MSSWVMTSHGPKPQAQGQKSKGTVDAPGMALGSLTERCHLPPTPLSTRVHYPTFSLTTETLTGVTGEIRTSTASLEAHPSFSKPRESTQ